MNNYGRYKINNDSTALIDDKSQFETELNYISGEPGYFLPHFFGEGDVLKSFGAAIISRASIDIQDIERIKDIYGLDPTFILSNKENTEFNIVFDYDRGIPKDDHAVISKSLATIYRGESVTSHFYEKSTDYVDKDYSSEKKFMEFTAMKAFSGIISDYDVERQQSKADIVAINELNKKNIQDVANDMQKFDAKLDTVLNISPVYGRVYDFILNQFKLPSEAKKWINETYGMSLVERVDLSKYRGQGEKIIEGKDFMLDDVGYFMLKEGNVARQTDFFVNVHYKIQKTEKESVFIVSLVNEIAGAQSNKVEWSNQLGRIPFAEFCQKLGNFHFIGSGTFISLLHAQISTYKDVPVITAVHGYGFHPELGVAIFENGIFDLKEKIFTEKVNTDDDYYFNYNGKGFLVTDVQGNPINETFKGIVPQILNQNLITSDDLFDVFGKLYNDYSGALAVIMTLGSMGYALYAEKGTDDTLPFLFVRGVTGSGKSSFMRLMQHMWGINGKAKHFETTTPFIFSVLLSYLSYCPLFLTEYREGGKDGDSKISTLRAVYDKTGAAKGRADQTVVNYNYRGLPMIDGEEMIKDPASRTRCIQLRFLSSHKVDTNFSAISKEAYPILDSVLYSYLMMANGDKYEEYLNEGFELFSKVSSKSSRVGANLKVIYAGCMCFDPTKKDKYIETLMRAGQFQDLDVKQNSNYSQIINAMGKYLEASSSYGNSVSFSEKNIVIPWSPLEDYIKMRKIEMSLKTDSYKDHLEENGFKIDYEDVGDKLAYGVVIPIGDIPNEFKVHPAVYEAVNIYKSGKKKIVDLDF